MWLCCLTQWLINMHVGGCKSNRGLAGKEGRSEGANCSSWLIPELPHGLEPALRGFSSDWEELLGAAP